jgi:predicted TIM-barrel fold metal-dependent hydrolase
MKIDFHCHYMDVDNFVEGLLKEMDDSGVDFTLLMGRPQDDFWGHKSGGITTNELVLEAVKAHPDRLIGNVILDPREEDAADTFDRYVDAGFKCVKMFPPIGFWPDDERFFPLYEKIERAGVPILFHSGLTNIKVVSKQPGVRKATNSKYSYPLNYDMISRLFPNLPIVLAHMGYPHYIEARSISEANPNVYLDISGGGPWTDGIPLVFNALGGHQFIPLDFTRVIWGSDNCLPQVEHLAVSDVFLGQMGASSLDKVQVFGGTAMKLLKLNKD